MERIYLDNNATTALDQRVLKAMLQGSGAPANPSSIHSFGREARAQLNKARNTVASFFSAKPEEIIFTSGGTEGINYLLRGLNPKGHILTTAIEHSSVYRTIQALASMGMEVTYIPVGLFGAPDPDAIEQAIRPETRAIVLTLSNAETGVKIDLERIGHIAAVRQIPLLLDAVSWIGKEPLNIPPNASFAISGHKFHAPKGVGAVICRSSLKLQPLITGGGQEHQKRAGTENLEGILGLAAALEILQKEQSAITKHLIDLKKRFETGLFASLPNLSINGEGPRISNTSNIAFLGVDGETLLMQLDLLGIAASHGSACSSGALEPSRVLTNMGIDRKTARSSIRFSFSKMNNQEEVDVALEKIEGIVKQLRKL